MASASYVSLLISSSVTAMSSERRYPSNTMLSKFKENLVLITGCDNKTMKLELRDDNDKFVKELTDDSKTLEELGVKNGYHVRVSDPNVKAGLYDDILNEEVEEFKLTDEEYAKRQDTILAWKKQNKLGRFKETHPEELKAAEEAKKAQLAVDAKKIESMKIGDRCEVQVPKQPPKRGEVVFLGETKFKEGVWVGVKYDEPVGKNDGSVEGYRYFQCQPKYGAFVKPSFVEVGDFPELGIDELDEL
nr:Cytoskeleton associated protein CAP Gly [Hymenolepis microstoma]